MSQPAANSIIYHIHNTEFGSLNVCVRNKRNTQNTKQNPNAKRQCNKIWTFYDWNYLAVDGTDHMDKICEFARPLDGKPNAKNTNAHAVSCYFVVSLTILCTIWMRSYHEPFSIDCVKCRVTVKISSGTCGYFFRSQPQSIFESNERNFLLSFPLLFGSDSVLFLI